MSDRRPNILWIMSEQTNLNCLGCYGSPDVKTPHIDALARGGVRFDHAYATNPICMPSRLSYLSGMYPHTHGFQTNGPGDMGPDPRFALTRLLREQAGYSSGMAGKTHIGTWEAECFDTRMVSTGSPAGNDFADYLRGKGYSYPEGKRTAEDHVNYDTLVTDVPYEHSQPTWTANSSMRVMDGLQEPFFMWTSFDKPHGPFHLPKDPPVEYDPATLGLPPGDIRRFKLKPFSQRLGIEAMWSIDITGEEAFRRGLAAYYTLISMVDDNIGNLVEYLRRRGILENTIIVYCADHGDFGGEHGQIGKNAIGGYEQLYHIPLVWSWAGQFGREVVNGMVENVDFFPTVCELLGLDVPAWVQGDSYAHALRMSAACRGYLPFPGKESVFFQAASITKTVRTRTHKLTYRFDGREEGELYDLIHDPMETENLFESPRHVHVREKLLRMLLDHLYRTEQPRVWSECEHRAAPPWRWFQKTFSGQLEVPPDRNRLS